MKLPKTIFGIDTEEAYKRYLEESKKEKKQPQTSQASLLEVKADIDKADYIQILDTNIIIAKQQDYNNLTWQDTQYALVDSGLYMSTPSLFMQHFVNAKDAAEGKIKLYDGNGNPIKKDEAKDIYNTLATDCWAWLDAAFKQENGKWNIETDHWAVMRGNDKTLEARNRSRLENCVRDDCFVDLAFNAQGLPTTKSQDQKYVQGQNIYFYQPKDGAVAGFNAFSVRAFLYCGGNPGYSYSSLGVYPCAEGAAKR